MPEVETLASFRPTGPDPGLCGSCRHGRRVVTLRGSQFWLCERSRSDPAFPRYAPLPVIACRGYQLRCAEEREQGG